MRELVLPSLVFVSLVVASLGAMVIVQRLPAHHHSDDTHTVIKQAATVFVLMASVLLGLPRQYLQQHLRQRRSRRPPAARPS